MNRKEKLQAKDPNRCIELIKQLPEAEFKAVRQSTRILLQTLSGLGAGLQMVSLEDLVKGINKRGK